MSGRLLKKVLQQLEEQQIQAVSDHEDEDEEEEEESQQLNGKASINPFDLLNDGDDDDGHDLEGDDDSETVDEPLIVPELKPKEVNSVSGSSKKSKKKKKKKKSKEGASSSSSTSNAEKPLDVILESLSLDAGTKDSDNLAKLCAPSSSALQVNPKYLNAENEMIKKFGAKVVKNFEKSERASGSRLVRGGRRGAHMHRKTMLVTPAEHWPRWDGSLSMECLQVTDGYHHFRYVHSSSYSQAQSAFEAAKATHDLNGIVAILLHYPYHLDSLIAMAEYYKFMGEHQMSAEFISKCLYALECAWNPMFTPLQGDCQLKYIHETNKPLFKVLFTHMKSIDMRGFHRSALEVCKLLVSLDSDDPMGAMFCIDYFSLRAEEYAWLERFSEEYKSDNSLWLFPNFSYSLAICRFYLEKEESSIDARIQTAKSTSTDLMKQALMLHPSVLKKLVAKVPLTDKVWVNILRNAFFQAGEVGIPSLDHLIDIYVERNQLLWRLPELQILLRDTALLVNETLRHDSREIKDWACVRNEAFSSEKNEYAHLLVSDFSLSAPSAPPEMLQHFMAERRMGDGMPDEHHVIGEVVGGQMEGGPALRDVANRNPLAVLLESMLPWVHYADGDGGIEENQLNGHAPGNDQH